MKPLDPLCYLTSGFFNRDPRRVARALLGKLLIRKSRGVSLAGRIVETEAYLGENDAAAHAAAGHTARNSVLFGPAGFAYVYFIYGMHYCLNVSCMAPGQPGGGVLMRALEPVSGIEHMAAARGIELSEKIKLTDISTLKKIASGPGRLAEAFGITRERDNGKNFFSPTCDLRIAEDGYRVRRVMVTPRIGIVKSAEHPLRFFIAGNLFVSGKTSS
jgi:DNA-3-methyladenine glycosylase